MSPSLGRTGQPKAGPVWLVSAQTLCFYSLIPSLAKLCPWAESTRRPWKHIRSQTLHRGSSLTSYKLFVSDHLSLFSHTPSMTPSCTVNFASPSRFQRGYFKNMSPASNHYVSTTLKTQCCPESRLIHCGLEEKNNHTQNSCCSYFFSLTFSSKF